MTTKCPFLDLPVELRLQIYEHLLLGNSTITIGTALVKGSYRDVVHRLYGGGRTPYEGIPEQHEPVIEAGYSASLLSTTNPAAIPADAPILGQERIYALSALRLVNRQTYNELLGHFRAPDSKQTSLFIQYPDGLHVLQTKAPQLLRQARSVHLAGKYTPRAFVPARAACMGLKEPRPELPVKYHGSVKPDEAAQLSDLIKTLCGDAAASPPPEGQTNFVSGLQKLEMRIYYPGDDSYSTVWGDDSSPVVIALRHVAYAEIGIEVWRGRYGTGVYLNIQQSLDAKRTVSTVWRKLEEGRRGEPACGSWVVDPEWPRWKVGYEASEGPAGQVIITQSA
ncbi:hypothetical protein Tdes44962_MAKER07080 [Teratosphaeria destructans]|uniref:F-box domain-containing protein n=1 Tax=Teratosphaeria destructans TaxID=418781 RepID=A0A9W7T0K8_9PEZI|nr:hypothetical protein Tdes44962_MAKER07080 [Teratosphaeria destructans]